MNNTPSSDRSSSDRITRSASAPKSARADELARYKRASLRDQSLRAVWRMEALLRRVKHEAPEVHTRLRCAVEALQLLSAKLALGSADVPPETKAAPRATPQLGERPRPCSDRACEFF